MTLAQGLAFAIVAVMMALFVWGRWRYDLVAGMALLAAVIAGIVPPDQAFKGFSDDIVIIVGSALVVSAAVARSGVIERVARWLGPYLVTIHRQLVALVGSVTVLSAFVKECRGARHDHADRLSARPPQRDLPVVAVDADVIRGAPRRHHDANRHLAEYHRVANAGRAARQAFRYVRFRTRRRRYCLCRLPLPDLWLASAPRSQGRRLDRCRFQSRRLHDRSDGARRTRLLPA